jgi:hypothetical protein
VALHSDLIGRRVVVRRVLRGETGPSGGPAMTDILGELTGWSPDELTVRRDDGSDVTVAQADVVAAKPIPARPEPRHRTT